LFIGATAAKSLGMHQPMRILGTKFWGHDSAFYYLDTDAQEIFALSTERVTRVKHDRIDITVALKQFPELRPDTVIHSYADFGDNNRDEENRKDGIVSLLKEKIARDFIKPRYGADLFREYSVPKEFIESHPLHAEMLRIMQLDGEDIVGLPDNGGMHRSAVEHTFKLLLARSGHSVPVGFADHHLCHAVSAYNTSPYCSEGRAAVVSFDGWGDHYFGKAFIFSADGYIELGKSLALPVTHNGRTNIVSIGEVYAAFTEGLGFRKYNDEGKIEALAAFGIADAQLLEALNAATQIRDRGIYLDPDRLAKYYDPTYIKNCSERIGIENCSATIQTYLEETPSLDI
jgi:carbamoyltransferase